jgi:hypothetical protein
MTQEWPAENDPFPGEEPDQDDDDFESDDEPEPDDFPDVDLTTVALNY